MTASDPLAAIKTLQNPQKLLHSGRRIAISFVNVQINRAAEPFSQGD
tara:strand:+ start:521 stop:661 length:141 start_codon:yes stop_codon:yes gene_type:complete